jgi:hypothetical protein
MCTGTVDTIHYTFTYSISNLFYRRRRCVSTPKVIVTVIVRHPLYLLPIESRRVSLEYTILPILIFNHHPNLFQNALQ